MISDIFKKYSLLLYIFLVVSVILVLTILIGYKKHTSKSYFINGLLMDFKNIEIISLTLILMNFIFLVYLLLSKETLNFPYIIISMLFIFLAYIILGKYKYLGINIIINIVNLSVIYFINLIDKLKIDNPSKLVSVLEILAMIFAILFYLFITVKYIYNIQRKDTLNEKNN